MLERMSFSPIKAVAAGALAGAVTFFALGAVKAQSLLTVSQLRSNPKAYVGIGEVQITGMASSVRNDTRKIDGQIVPVLKINVYEVDSKGKKGSHYVYAVVPASRFNSVPLEGGMVTITGPLKWPYEIAAIDP